MVHVFLLALIGARFVQLIYPLRGRFKCVCLEGDLQSIMSTHYQFVIFGGKATSFWLVLITKTPARAFDSSK